jgi:hypothetical protein
MMTSLLPHLEEERTPIVQRNLLISIMSSAPVRRTRRWICVNGLDDVGDILMNPHLGGIQGKFLQTVNMETMLTMQAEGGLLHIQKHLLCLTVGMCQEIQIPSIFLTAVRVKYTFPPVYMFLYLQIISTS